MLYNTGSLQFAQRIIKFPYKVLLDLRVVLYCCFVLTFFFFLIQPNYNLQYVLNNVSGRNCRFDCFELNLVHVFH